MVALSACGVSKTGGGGPRGKLNGERDTPNGALGGGGPDASVHREDWFNLNPDADAREGESVNKVYELLGNRVNDLAPVIVAVIDSGVDITHEDLKNKIWTNPGETGLDANGNDKATNGIDDDGDGYIDDVHGWNFLGGYDANGKPVSVDAETLEKTRILKKLNDRIAAGETLSADDKALHDQVEGEVNSERKDAQDDLAALQPAMDNIAAAYPTIKPLVNKDIALLTRVDVANIQSDDAAITAARDKILAAFDASGFPAVSRIQQFIGIDNDSLNFNLNVDYNPRATIVKDNPDDFSDTHYGNNDVAGASFDHGTHVSGMIAAERGNNIGIDGIATTAQIMSLRAVPNGDERDKDIALAIRFAADHGARVVNMSFGKEYSPGRAQVQAAIEYAEAKGVLLVHAAGNDSKNTTTTKDRNFPAPEKIDGGKYTNWLEVGASGDKKNASLPAVFSNYGKESVDIFAPGVKIESTTPNNTYSIFSGTSMASPSLAGAAALLLSLKPDLTAPEVRDLLLKNGRNYDGLMVNIPSAGGPLGQILFSELSITGKVADALSSVKALLDL